MAWIKVTRHSTGTQYCINTDKLVTFGRPEGAGYTNLWEPGEDVRDVRARMVRETPDELLALIREAEFVGYPGIELLNYAYPPEELK